MPNGAKNWFYTLNNYTDDELEKFSRLPEGAVFHLFGKEVGKGGTPHLQGVLGYSKRKTMESIKNEQSRRLHLQPCRDVRKAIEYCSKDGLVSSFGDVPVSDPRGKRSDLERFKAAVVEGCYDLKRLRDEHSEVLAKYPRFAVDYVRDHRPRAAVESYPLRPWQQELYEKLRHPPDPRTIIFVVDLRGNSGKSWFCDYYDSIHRGKCQVMNPGKKADMALCLDENIRVLFLDAPRSKQGDYIQYDFLEDVKNGRVFSGKYESGMKYLGPCHVVVMMNEHPDMMKLSEDRYDIMDVSN